MQARSTHDGFAIPHGIDSGASTPTLYSATASRRSSTGPHETDAAIQQAMHALGLSSGASPGASPAAAPSTASQARQLASQLLHLPEEPPLTIRAIHDPVPAADAGGPTAAADTLPSSSAVPALPHSLDAVPESSRSGSDYTSDSPTRPGLPQQEADSTTNPGPREESPGAVSESAHQIAADTQQPSFATRLATALAMVAQDGARLAAGAAQGPLNLVKLLMAMLRLLLQGQDYQDLARQLAQLQAAQPPAAGLGPGNAAPDPPQTPHAGIGEASRSNRHGGSQ